MRSIFQLRGYTVITIYSEVVAMRESEIGNLTCPVARTIGVIGDSWTLLIIRELFLRTRRFEEFQALTGMSPRLVTARLARLQENGIIKRVQYDQKPARFEYRLTEKGLELHALTVLLGQWGKDWAQPEGELEPPLELVHKPCGHVFKPVMTCSCCGEPIGHKDVDVRIGAAMNAERAAMREAFFESINRKTVKEK